MFIPPRACLALFLVFCPSLRAALLHTPFPTADNRSPYEAAPAKTLTSAPSIGELRKRQDAPNYLCAVDGGDSLTCSYEGTCAVTGLGGGNYIYCLEGGTPVTTIPTTIYAAFSTSAAACYIQGVICWSVTRKSPNRIITTDIQ